MMDSQIKKLVDYLSKRNCKDFVYYKSEDVYDMDTSIVHLGKMEDLIKSFNRSRVTTIISDTDRSKNVSFYCLTTDATLSSADLSGSPCHSDDFFKTIIRMFGRLESDGSTLSPSICVNVHGYHQYLYVRLQDVRHMPEERVKFFKEMIENKVCTRLRSIRASGVVLPDEFYVIYLGANVVERLEQVYGNSTSIFVHEDYSNRKSNRIFIKIFLTSPTFMPHVVECLKSPDFGDIVDGIFEHFIPTNDKFLVDTKFKTPTFLTLNRNAYYIRDKHQKESTCDMEIDILYTDLLEATFDSIQKPIILRTLYLDIETKVLGGVLIDGRTPIYTIACHIADYNILSNESVTILDLVLTSRSCDAFDEAKVVAFAECDHGKDNLTCMCDLKNEATMLLFFTKLVTHMDVDILCGHNIRRFDLPSIQNRIRKLSKQDDGLCEILKNCNVLGRLVGADSISTDCATKQTWITWKDDKGYLMLCGRLIVDSLELFKKHTKDESCKLKFLSRKYLASEYHKKEFPMNQINRKFDGNSSTRAEIAKYCFHDASIIEHLLMKVKFNSIDSVLQYYFLQGRGFTIQQEIESNRLYYKFLSELKRTRIANKGIRM